jgi:hypothetical protein
MTFLFKLNTSSGVFFVDEQQGKKLQKFLIDIYL